MAAFALSGDDTITLIERTLVDLADGDVGSLEYPNDIANVKVGKNGNAIFSYNASGKMGRLRLRVIRASADDKYIQGLLAAQQNNFNGTPTMYGQVIKKVGDGTGATAKDTYNLGAGVFTKYPPVKTNVEGDSNQSVVEYEITFANAVRVIR